MAILPNINEVQSLLTQAQEVLIVTHENPNPDSLGASLALFLSLKAAGKKVTAACPTAPTVEFTHLVGIDKINQTLGGKNFIISLDYIEGAIEKVSYNISHDKFNLVIEPRPGAPTFSPEKVHYSSSAASPDLIFLIDCLNLEQLGKFYTDEKEMYSKVATVNIDYHPNNSLFGRINLVEPEASSTSELVVFLIQTLGLPLNEDTATNLLAGIDFATKNFAPGEASVGAFEAAAFCLKAGGKRGGIQIPTEEIPHEAPADWLQPKIFKSSSSSQPLTPKDESTLL